MSPASVDDAKAAVRHALAGRGAGKTLCPSEIARDLAGGGAEWRDRMGEVHRAVDALLAEGTVVLSWQGRRLPERQGPYRIASA